MIFANRFEAGEKLAAKLIPYAGKKTIIVALPRGGVPVGAVISQKLKVPLEILIVRKLGFPKNPELGIGAVSESNVVVIDDELINALGVKKKYLTEIIQQERMELKRRVNVYRKSRSITSLKDKTVILVDDGIATGITVKAALKSVRKLKPKQTILAVPVIAKDILQNLIDEVDHLIYLIAPLTFSSVGIWYKSFTQMSDEEVLEYLNNSLS